MKLTSSLQHQIDLNATDGAQLSLQMQLWTSGFENANVYLSSPRLEFFALNCSHPTPISDLDTYTSNVQAHHGKIAQIVNGIPPRGLVMGSFAQAPD
jgi:hypothetical protein